MGCKCCKMIQSYLFDPVQVPSPGYINEVNSCKLDEDDNVKFKVRTSSQALVPKTEPPSEGLKRTASRSAAPTSNASPPRSDPSQDPCADKTWGSSNGVGPTPPLQPAEGSPQDDRGSCASTENGVHPSQPFLEGQDVGGPDRESPAWEATPGILNGDSRAPELGELGLQLPPPDYPAPWGSAATGEENDHLCPHPSDDGCPQPPVHPASAAPAVDPAAVSPQMCRDSHSEALSTDTLSVCWKDGDSAPLGPLLVDCGNGWAEAEAYEDAAVAEALAALEAATAGEDVDEAE